MPEEILSRTGPKALDHCVVVKSLGHWFFVQLLTVERELAFPTSHELSGFFFSLEDITNEDRVFSILFGVR